MSYLEVIMVIATLIALFLGHAADGPPGEG